MGKRGKRIRNIAQKSEQYLRNMLLTDVYLKMVVTNIPKSTVQPETHALST